MHVVSILPCTLFLFYHVRCSCCCTLHPLYHASVSYLTRLLYIFCHVRCSYHTMYKMHVAPILARKWLIHFTLSFLFYHVRCIYFCIIYVVPILKILPYTLFVLPCKMLLVRCSYFTCTMFTMYVTSIIPSKLLMVAGLCHFVISVFRLFAWRYGAAPRRNNAKPKDEITKKRQAK